MITISWQKQTNLLMFILIILVGSLTGCQTSHAQEQCNSVTTVDGQPQVAVVLLDGVGSEETDSGSFAPLTINYCPIDPNGNNRGWQKDNSNRDWPKGLSQNLSRWSEFNVPSGASSGSGSSSHAQVTNACTISGGFQKDNCLVAKLANTGAVLLPFSYIGAYLDKNSIFHFQSYSSDDSKQEISKSVSNLDKEVSSIHSVWPKTRLIVIGHSLGGLVSELWWECTWGMPSQSYVSCPTTTPPVDHRGVKNVFTLDSPINGVLDGYCAASSVLAAGDAGNQFCTLWDNRPQRDITIIQLDNDQSFIPFGTPNDPTYCHVSVGPIDVDIGCLYSQMVYQCDNSNDMTNTPCISEPPSHLVKDPSCDGKNGNIEGTINHDIVKTCPEVIDLIRTLVLAARDKGPQSGGNPIASPIPTSTSTLYSEEVLKNHPSAYYRLDESAGTIAHDSSGAGYDATYMGSTLKLGQAGIPGTQGDLSVILAGNDGYISSSNQSTPLNATQGSHDRTVELWFRTAQSDANINVFATGTSGTGSIFDIALVGSDGPGGCGSQPVAGVYIRFWDNDLQLPVPQLTDNQWHYVAVTVGNSGSSVNVVVDGTQPTAYVWDGSCYTTALQPQPFTLPHTIHTAASPFGIGNSDWGIGFTGDVDEAAIYPTALSASELEKHYHLGSGK